MAELFWGCQSIKLLHSLLSLFSLLFVLFLTSLLQVSRICPSWTLALWVAGNSSLFFSVTRLVRKDNEKERWKHRKGY